jgi:hypothetical protein
MPTQPITHPPDPLIRDNEPCMTCEIASGSVDVHSVGIDCQIRGMSEKGPQHNPVHLHVLLEKASLALCIELATTKNHGCSRPRNAHGRVEADFHH